MRHVYLVSGMSKDPSTQIGAITVKDRQVLTSGFNGICRGVVDHYPERLVSPGKYLWFEHAERNACFAAAREGIKVRGATMYTQDIPCADCCRAVIQSGITSLVIHGPWSRKWKELQGNSSGMDWSDSQNASFMMLREALVEVVTLQQQLNLTTLMKGQYHPV